MSGYKSKSPYVCERCGLPLREVKSGWVHAVNAATKARSCGPVPVAVKRGDQSLKTGQVVTLWRPAGSVTIGNRPFLQRFGATSFDHLINTVTPFRRGGEIAAYLVITKAEVAGDGSGVTLTMEVIDSAEEQEAA